MSYSAVRESIPGQVRAARDLRILSKEIELEQLQQLSPARRCSAVPATLTRQAMICTRFIVLNIALLRKKHLL
jgi:hypothetical protein